MTPFSEEVEKILLTDYTTEEAVTAIISLVEGILPKDKDIRILCLKLADNYSSDETDPIRQDIFKDSKKAINSCIAEIRRRLNG